MRRGVRRNNAPQRWRLTRECTFAPLPRSESFQSPLTHSPPNQAQCWKSDFRRHAPDLAILAFPQNQLQPTGRDGFTNTNRRDSRPEPGWRINSPCFARLCNEISQIEPPGELFQGLIGCVAIDLDEVTLGKLVGRIGNARLKPAVVRQHHEPFGIRIQSARRIDAGYRYIVGQRGPAVRRSELGQHAEGLVEEKKLAHLVRFGQRIRPCRWYSWHGEESSNFRWQTFSPMFRHNATPNRSARPRMNVRRIQSDPGR